MNLRRHLYALPFAAALLLLLSGNAFAQTSYSADVGQAAVVERTTDTSLTQNWASIFGYTFMLPVNAKYNKVQSKVDEAGMTEQANFILRGGAGSITFNLFSEQRMLPVGYALLDSTIHIHDNDSVGVNGKIYRRVFIMRDQAVEALILLTEKGQAEYANLVRPIFDSFQPKAEWSNEMHDWRYGRDPNKYEQGRYGKNSGPTRNDP